MVGDSNYGFGTVLVVVSVTEMVMITVDLVVVMETGYGIKVVVLITKMVMVTVDMVVVMVRLVIVTMVMVL